MEGFKAIQHILVAISVTLFVISGISVNGQISTPCTTSMISSFTPCLNFITGSSGNGSAPTAACCSTLQSLTRTSMDCACLLIVANLPLQLPINRTLAISLPRACNLAGVPMLCKATGTPLPAPGPALLGPTLPPPTASAFSPQASKASSLAPALAPDSESTPQLAPASAPVDSENPTTTPGIRPVLTPSAPVDSENPTTTPGIRPVLTPSASNPSFSSSPPLLLIFVGILVLKY